MLELITIFLTTLIVSATAVWLYRRIPNKHGFKQITAGNSETTMKRWPKVQQSFNPSTSLSQARVKFTKLPKSKGHIKVPWGW